ncbi:redoxin domain-containing protein [Mucilaginibacter lacusdianchii]|uniref:redoxin domain-containing protein n=1 Tax=Mucilaginibacter lacusdianchii TaxID=2684211 RepID=UPI00131C4A6A|nr:redoxin domain-containing protein [Mucilaginibacter sp. JXJ CY 39]
MLNQRLNFPAFDALEYTPELEFSNNRHVALSPLKYGSTVIELDSQGKTHSFLSENLFNNFGISFSYITKPLVLYFYSQEWGTAGIQHLKQLNGMRHELDIYNINVLVIHSERAEKLNRTFWEHNISLEAYHDANHEIARLFGIFHENSPAWSKYAGVENNIPLPAVYALDHERKVVFDFANQDIQTHIPVNELKNAVATYAQYSSHKKSA